MTHLIKKIDELLIQGKLLKECLRITKFMINKFFSLAMNFVFIKKVDKAIKVIYGNIFPYFFKTENSIIFLTFQGSFTCNPKAILSEFQDQDCSYRLVWCIKKDTPLYTLPLDIEYVKFGTRDFYKELAKSKVIIQNTNIFERLNFKKKKGQYLYQTWHGSLGIKRLDGKAVSGKKWDKVKRKCSKNVDFCFSNSSFETDVYKSSYWSKTPILLTGHARNDIFFKDDKFLKNIKESVRKSFQIDSEKKICLYAPTHFDSKKKGFEVPDFDLISEALTTRFGGKWVVFVRLHNRKKDKSQKILSKFISDTVIDASIYPDIQELLVSCDVGITDYSSWIFDFILSEKPGFILLNDFEYFSESRGFYYPLTETPFTLACNSSELQENILNFNADIYSNKLSAFITEKGCIDDGNSSKRIVAQIRTIIENEL